jgi:hypothetical protein
MLLAGAALAMAAPIVAVAQTPSAAELQLLRQEMARQQADHEARMQALEARLQAAESALAAPPATPPALSEASPPATNTASAGANGFNPQLSLILSGTYTRTAKDPASWTLSGVPMPAGAEAGPGSRGFNLGESELGLAASIDPWWRGAANFSLHPDDTVSVEEAFVQTTALGQGLSLKAGRFFSGVGYLNSQHAHTWDFVDNPLVYQGLLGTQYADDGLQLRWLAPTDRYMEWGAELGRGRSFPGSDTGRNGSGMNSLFVHLGDDVGESSSWRAGISVLQAKASDQALALPEVGDAALSYTGRTRVWVADGVWKWAPMGNATRTSFKLQGEWLRSTREGSLAVDTAQAAPYRVTQSGWYLQGVYQFMAVWRLGLRTEALDPGAPSYGLNAAALTGPSHRPRKDTLMLDYSASEFSRVRLQWAQDRSRAGGTDNQLQLQYQMSLGAHGAHSY